MSYKIAISVVECTESLCKDPTTPTQQLDKFAGIIEHGVDGGQPTWSAKLSDRDCKRLVNKDRVSTLMRGLHGP
jgi:hypothetical protein